MSKRGQEATSNDGSPTAKARPVNLVMHSQYKEETSSSSLGSRVNPENDDERKRMSQAPGNWEHGNSKSEVENSQVSRQEKILQATRKLWQKDQTQIKSEEHSPGTRKLAACSPEFTKHGIHETIDTWWRSFKFGKKLGMSAINATFSMDSYKTNVLTWRLFLPSSMKAAIHLGPDFLTNSEIYKNTKFEKMLECFQHYSEVDKGTFCRNSECGMPGIFITIMDEINIGQSSSGQVCEGKSMYLRWFFCLCRTGERYFRSNRKMERSSWSSQEVFVVPRRSGTRRRTDWIRVDKFPRIFVIISSSRDPERLGDKEHQARRLQGPDHLHVKVHWHCMERDWWELYFECRRGQELRHEVPTRTLDVSGSRIRREVVWRFPRSKRTVELHRQQDGTAIQRHCSSCLQKYQCFESWNIEAKERQMYHSLQWRFFQIQNSCSKQFTLSISSVSSEQLRIGVTNSAWQKKKKDESLFLWTIKFWPWWSQKKWNCWYLLRPRRLETGCKEAHWASKFWKRRYSLHNFVKKSLLPTSCDCRGLLQISTKCRRRMGKRYSSVSRIFEFSILSENQSIVSYSLRHHRWASSRSSRCKNSWQILHEKLQFNQLQTQNTQLTLWNPEKKSVLWMKFMITNKSSGPAMNCSQTFTNQEGMKKEK